MDVSSITRRSKDKRAKGLPVRVARRGREKVDKYARYRQRVGKPNGPGQPGSKAGRNRAPST